MFSHVHQDAWWDELISLKDYALVGFKDTVTLYPEPGNHIFFNLFDNVVSRIVGVRDFYEMLDHLWKLRLAQGLVAIGTCAYVFLTTKRFFSKRYASLAAIILASTIPFLNFSLQLRGYNMSMFFVSMVIYHGWSYLDGRKLPHLILTGLTSCLLLYTIPSNVYFLFGLSAVIVVDWLFQFRNQNKQAEDKKGKKKKTKGLGLFSFPHLWALAAIGIGTGITFLAYQPVIEQLLDNRFVSKAPPERSFVLATVFPAVIKAFFSFRWLLLIPILGGLFFWINKKDLDFDRGRLAQILVAFLLPFVFLLIHEKVPFERTFIHLAPVFAILIAGISALFLEGLKLSETIKQGIIAILAIYCFSNYIWQDGEINAHLDKNLERNKREQNIYNAFFLADNFQPHKAIRSFIELNDTNAAILLIDELDRVSYQYYLDKYQLESYAMIRIQQVKNEANGRTFSHMATFQKTMGRDKKTQFRRVPANLDQKNKAFNDYYLLPRLAGQFERGKNMYLFTGFPKKAEKAFSMFFKDRLDLTRQNEFGFANLYKIEPKRISPTP
jgi:hypothetical protein